MRLWRDGHQPTALVKIIDTPFRRHRRGFCPLARGYLGDSPIRNEQGGVLQSRTSSVGVAQGNCSEDTPATRGEGGNKHYYAPARFSVLQSSTSARGGVEKTIPRSRNELARS
jgi:hypothetical protein